MIRTLVLMSFLVSLGACASSRIITQPPQLTQITQTHRDLLDLPMPVSSVPVAVYSFRDLTGQYKPAPSSYLSSSVTQGADSILVNTLSVSKWFTPVERKGLQNILTERKVIRAIIGQDKPGEGGQQLTKLLPARIILEGGVVAYESNVVTGGFGFRYLGIGPTTEHRMDQVTINLRAVDVETGKIIDTVSTTKTILSHKFQASMYRFVAFKKLLEAEVGVTYNEPAQLCVMEAIQAAVIHLVVQGIQRGNWSLANPSDMQSEVLQRYIRAEAAFMPRRDRQLVTKAQVAPIEPPQSAPPAMPRPTPPVAPSHPVAPASQLDRYVMDVAPAVIAQDGYNKVIRNISIPYNPKALSSHAIPSGRANAEVWVVNLATVGKKEIGVELKRIRSMGIPAEVNPVRVNGKTLYRISVTGFHSLQEAENEKKTLIRRLGIKNIWINKLDNKVRPS